jgi:hypothetical protein
MADEPKKSEYEFCEKCGERHPTLEALEEWLSDAVWACLSQRSLSASPHNMRLVAAALSQIAMETAFRAGKATFKSIVVPVDARDLPEDVRQALDRLIQGAKDADEKMPKA